MDYYRSSELYHHGILGMKWGVRRFQNKDGTYTNAGKARRNKTGKNIVNTFSGSVMSQKVSGFMDDIDPDVADAAVSCITTIALVALTRVALRTALNKAFRADSENRLDDLYKSRDIDSLSTAPKLKKTEAPSDSMKVVNPGYPKSGRTDNCVLCTTAMAMREKGYDVIAAESDMGFYTDQAFKKMFNAQNEKLKGIKSGKDLQKKLAANGEGSYGNLSVFWPLGGGHSIFWKVENGQTHIYDGQSGEEYTRTAQEFDKFFAQINAHNITCNRLDNCTPTEYALSAVRKQ